MVQRDCGLSRALDHVRSFVREPVELIDKAVDLAGGRRDLRVELRGGLRKCLSKCLAASSGRWKNARVFPRIRVVCAGREKFQVFLP